MRCMFCVQGEDLKKALYNGKEIYTHTECAEINQDYHLIFTEEVSVVINDDEKDKSCVSICNNLVEG